MAEKASNNTTIDKAQANETLANVFEACNQPPNGVAVDQLLDSKKNTVHPYNVWIVVSLVALILTFLSPLALNPVSNRVKTVDRGVANVIITDHQVTEDSFIMTLSGDFIDYTSIYAKTADGTKVYPTSYSTTDGVVTFPYSDEELNIYISDYNKNELHLLLSPKAN